MNQQQLQMQLLSAKEQAETYSPGLAEQIAILLKLVEDYDSLPKNQQDMLEHSAKGWLLLVKNARQANSSMPDIMKDVCGENVPEKMTAFISYMGQYAIDFGITLLNLKELLGSTDQYMASVGEEDIALIAKVLHQKATHAKLFFQSLGINRPDDAMSQMLAFQQTSMIYAKKSGIRIAICDIEKVNNLSDVQEEDIIDDHQPDEE